MITYSIILPGIPSKIEEKIPADEYKQIEQVYTEASFYSPKKNQQPKKQQRLPAWYILYMGKHPELSYQNRTQQQQLTNTQGNNVRSNGIYYDHGPAVGQRKGGYMILANKDFILTKVTKDARCNATKAYIYSSDGSSLLASSDFVDNDASFGFSAKKGTSYRVLVDNSGLDYGTMYKDYVTLPITSTEFTWTHGIDGSIVDSPYQTGRSIQSISTVIANSERSLRNNSSLRPPQKQQNRSPAPQQKNQEMQAPVTAPTNHKHGGFWEGVGSFFEGVGTFLAAVVVGGALGTLAAIGYFASAFVGWICFFVVLFLAALAVIVSPIVAIFSAIFGGNSDKKDDKKQDSQQNRGSQQVPAKS